VDNINIVVCTPVARQRPQKTIRQWPLLDSDSQTTEEWCFLSCPIGKNNERCLLGGTRWDCSQSEESEIGVRRTPAWESVGE
jgi:hypothetical protein